MTTIYLVRDGKRIPVGSCETVVLKPGDSLYLPNDSTGPVALANVALPTEKLHNDFAWLMSLSHVD